MRKIFYLSLKYYIMLDIPIYTLGKNKQKYFINLWQTANSSS